MIGFGAYLLLSGSAGPQAGVANLWQHGGFFPHGIHGFIMALAVIMFAFGGLELIGIAAAETKKPETTIPKSSEPDCVPHLDFLYRRNWYSFMSLSLEYGGRRW